MPRRQDTVSKDYMDLYREKKQLMLQIIDLKGKMVKEYIRMLKLEYEDALRGMAGKFVDTISIFNRKRNSVKMNISGFAKIFHEQMDEIV